MIIIINTKNRKVREFRNRKERKQDILERWANIIDVYSHLISAYAFMPFWKNHQQRMDFINEIADGAKQLVSRTEEVRKCKH